MKSIGSIESGVPARKSREPALPGDGQQHDPQPDGPDTSSARLDAERQGGDGRSPGAGEERRRNEGHEQVGSRVGEEPDYLAPRQEARMEPVGEDESDGGGHDHDAVQEHRPPCFRLQAASQCDHQRRHSQHGPDDIADVRRGAQGPQAPMEDVRSVGDGLAHGGQRNRDGERGAEPPVLGLASDGRDATLTAAAVGATAHETSSKRTQ